MDAYAPNAPLHVSVAHIMAAAFPQWSVLELTELLGTAERISNALRRLPELSLPIPVAPAVETPMPPATAPQTEPSVAAVPAPTPTLLPEPAGEPDTSSDVPPPPAKSRRSHKVTPHHPQEWWNMQPVGLIKDRLLSELWGHDHKTYSSDRQLLGLPCWSFGRTSSQWSVLLTAWATEQIEAWLASLPAAAATHADVVALREQLGPVVLPPEADRGKWARRSHSIPSSREEEERLVREAVASGKVTVAPKRPTADYPAHDGLPGEVMTSAAWNEVYGDAVAVRRRGQNYVTVTLCLARDVCGVPGVDLLGDGRAPLADLVPVDEEDASARRELVVLASEFLADLVHVRQTYPVVAELEHAHQTIDNAPLVDLVEHVKGLACVYSRWQGDVHAD